VFDGKISLKDFLKIIPVKDVDAFEKIKGESETLAGFLLELSQALPRKGQTVHFDTWTFTIEAVDQKRIKRVKLSL